MAHKVQQLHASTATTAANSKTVKIDNEYGSAFVCAVALNSVSSVGSTDGVQVTIYGLVPGSTANPYTIIASSNITTTGIYAFAAGIGLSTASSSVSVNHPAWKEMAAQLTFSTSNAGFGASVSIDLIS